MAWPKRMLDGVVRQWSLDTLYDRRERFKEDFAGRTSGTPPGQQWLMGYVIPPFQRPIVWDEDRCVRLVESAILGLGIGSWVYNVTDDLQGCSKGEMHLWLLDGQQRLHAFDRYFDDAFPVFGLRWSETPRRDQVRLLNNTMFPAIETRHSDERILREIYDRMNFGGVAHTADQRAVPDDEEPLATMGLGR